MTEQFQNFTIFKSPDFEDEDSQEKEIVIEVTYYQDAEVAYSKRTVIKVDEMSDDRIKQKVKTAAEWAENGLNSESM